MIADHYAARRAVPRDGEVPYRPLPPDRLYLDRAAGTDDARRRPAAGVLPVRQARRRAPASMAAAGPGRSSPRRRRRPRRRRVRAVRAPGRALDAEKRRIVVAAWTRGSRERLAHLLREHGFKDADGEPRRSATGRRQAGARRRSRWSRSASSAASSPTAWPWWASRTCSASASAARRAAASAPTSSSPRPPRSPRATWSCTRNTASAATTGWRRCTSTGAPHDCLRLIYDGDEKLFLPVENIEMLSRFGSETQGVALDKLGGTGWQTRKARMKQPHPRHGRRADPHRRRAPDARRRR